MEEPDQETKNRVLDYLNRSGHQSPLSEDLKHSLSKSTKIVSPSVNIYQQVKRKIHSLYLKIAKLPVFKYGIVAFFLFQFITQLIFVITLIFLTSRDGDTQLNFQILKNFLVFNF